MNKKIKEIVFFILIIIAVGSISYQKTSAASGTKVGSGVYNNYNYDEYTSYIEITGYTGDETKIEIPESINNKVVTNIADCAFLGKSNITSISMSDEISYLGRNVFEDCTSLTEIKLSSSIREIAEDDFGGCTSLLSIKLPSGVEFISRGAFWGCSNLRSIEIPKSVTLIENAAFENCTNLNIIYGNINSYAEDYAKINGYRFLQGLIYGDFRYDGNSTRVSIIAYMNEEQFVDVPNNINGVPVESIGTYAFTGADGTAFVYLEDGIQYIKECAFYDCYNLSSIYIPESVIGIYDGAFDGCSDNLIIYGEKGSFAEKYAKSQGYTFIC